MRTLPFVNPAFCRLLLVTPEMGSRSPDQAVPLQFPSVFNFSFAYSALACFRMGMSGALFPECEPYALAGAEASCPDCFAGASAIRATPMMTSAATPSSSPRGIRLRNACTAITAA